MAVIEADLIVEDGTGLIGANAYVDFAFTDEYHRLRNNSVWSEATENDKAVSIIRASQYIDERFCFRGNVLNPEDMAEDPDPADGPQGLEFPRDSIYNRNGIDVGETVPLEIQEATAEYALRVLGDGTAMAPLQPDPDLGDDPRTITAKREKVGPIEEETKYDSTRGVRMIQPYPAADQIIWNSGFTKSSGGFRSVR